MVGLLFISIFAIAVMVYGLLTCIVRAQCCYGDPVHEYDNQKHFHLAKFSSVSPFAFSPSTFLSSFPLSICFFISSLFSLSFFLDKLLVLIHICLLVYLSRFAPSLRRYQLDADSDAPPRLRVGGPLGTSSLQLTPRGSRADDDDADVNDSMLDADRSAGGILTEEQLAMDDREVISSLDQDADEFLPTGADVSIEIRNRMRRRRFVRCAIVSVSTVSIALLALVIAGFVLNRQASASVGDVVGNVNDAFQRYQTPLLLASPMQTGADAMSVKAGDILKTTNLPAQQQNDLVRLRTVMGVVKADAKLYAAAMFSLNPLNAGSILSRADDVRSAFSYTLLTALCIAAAALVISMLQFCLRCRIEHETPSRGGAFSCECPSLSPRCCFRFTVFAVIIVALIGTAFFASYGFAFAVALADWCQDPRAWSEALYGMGQPTFNATLQQRTLAYVAACAAGTTNPLLTLLVPIKADIRNATIIVDDFVFYANTQSPPTIPAALALQALLSDIKNSTDTAVASLGSCARLHDDGYRAINAVCTRFVIDAAQLAIIMFAAACALVLVRPCWNVIRFYHSHELRARRVLQQLNAGGGATALGFDAMGPGAPPSAPGAGAAKIATVRPSLSQASNRKRFD